MVGPVLMSIGDDSSSPAHLAGFFIAHPYEGKGQLERSLFWGRLFSDEMEMLVARG